MCGIVGFISYSDQLKITGQELVDSVKKLRSRGPDSLGTFMSEQIQLGHCRLSIIDIEGGNQPMYSQDKNIVIVFNGEIYNFQELKNMLIEKNYNFSTHSDTEVLINGYLEWGIDNLLDKIDGPFSFALYDKRYNTTYLVRDRFGEKPLYYHVTDEHICFASELKAIEDKITDKSICLEALNLFLSLSYIPAPYTIYKNVYKLQAAHYLKINETGINKVCYYSLKDNIRCDNKITFKEAKGKLKTLLNKSIKQKMISDVPCGAFLSGGIDSSIIVGLMKEHSESPIDTFTIGFREKSFDESDRAKLVAEHFKTNQFVFYLNYDEIMADINKIIDYFDEPYGDSSAIPSYYIAKFAREKTKVALTGDCGDELFGGYEKYLANYYAKRWRSLPGFIKTLIKYGMKFFPKHDSTLSLLRKINKIIDFSKYEGFDLMYAYMCLGFSDEERLELLRSDMFVDVKHIIEPFYMANDSEDNLNKNMIGDVNIVLEGDMFPKGDRCGMMNSVEERTPFLSRELVEFALSLPSKMKIKGRNKKYILKETYKSLLPSKTIKYRKHGFGAPIDYWFQNELKDELLQLADKSFLQKQSIFNHEQINEIINEHLTNIKNHSGKLWNFYVFQKWYLQHFNIK